MRQDIFLQPEPFEFEFEPPFGGFETGFDEFGVFETFENEAMVGGIPEKDYLRWIQFSLNMYFKKTGLRAPLVEDGKDSADFRNAVELFNAKAWDRSKNKRIDEKFQDALIRVNESNSGYLKWLRAQLDKLGFAPLTVAYAAHEKPTKAIEEFQRIYSGKYGFPLERDGFVGAKTHLALLHAIKGITPVKPPPRTIKIETLSIWVNAFIPNDLPEKFLYRPFAGPHAYKVFLRAPGFPADLDNYATDWRSWSKSPDASSRMHARIDINVAYSTSKTKKVSFPSIRIDRFGKVQCKKTADAAKDITIEGPHWIDSHTVSAGVYGAGANPCTPSYLPTPLLDFELDIRVSFSSDRRSAWIDVEGRIDEFPSFEMYAAANGDFKNAVTVFRAAASKEGPIALIGDPVRSINSSKQVVATK